MAWSLEGKDVKFDSFASILAKATRHTRKNQVTDAAEVIFMYLLSEIVKQDTMYVAFEQYNTDLSFAPRHEPFCLTKITYVPFTFNHHLHGYEPLRL
jgi:hypothetical protein